MARQLAIALLQMDPESQGIGWMVPADYQAVHDVFRELHIGPYAGTAPMTLGDVVRKYWAFGVAGPGRKSGVARTGGSAGRPPLYVNALLPLK